MASSTYAKWNDIMQKMIQVGEDLKTIKIQNGALRKCRHLVARAFNMWPEFNHFTSDIRRDIAEELKKAQGEVGRGPIWVQINEIIQLLLPPQFATVYNDILELGSYSDAIDTLLPKLEMCANIWRKAAQSGDHGRIEFNQANYIFACLFNVVQTMQKEPHMENNTRLEYIKTFLQKLGTDLQRPPVSKPDVWGHEDLGIDIRKNATACFLHVCTLLEEYDPPELVLPPEDEDEETETTPSQNSGADVLHPTDVSIVSLSRVQPDPRKDTHIQSLLRQLTQL